MNIIIFLLILTSVGQVFVCHVSLWIIVSILCRLLFALRIMGVTFKVRNLMIGEGAALACMVVFNMLFSGGNFPWLRLLFMIIFDAIAGGLEILDEILYVYLTVPVEDE